MIHCIKCYTDKPESEYYRSTLRANGKGECKTCTRARVVKNRKERADYYKEYERSRANLPHRVKAREEYTKTVKGKERHKSGVKAYRTRNPKRYQAHNLVNNAVRDGKLFKPSVCESCSVGCNPHGHHCDYSKPLDVMWLCDPCHKKWHRENTPIYCSTDQI